MQGESEQLVSKTNHDSMEHEFLPLNRKRIRHGSPGLSVHAQKETQSGINWEFHPPIYNC